VANIKSAKKRARQNPKRRLRNRMHKGAARTLVKKVRACIEAGDYENGMALFRQAQSKLDSVARKGIIKKNTAARLKRRLNAGLKKLAQSAA